MSSYRQIVKDEVFLCKLNVHKERFRKKSFEGQNNEFGLIDVHTINGNSYLGSMPLWWNDDEVNHIMESGEWREYIHRITVSTLKPMIHRWTYEDCRKGRCRVEDRDKIELLSSGKPKIYNQISFLVRKNIDNETHRWESRESDIEEAFRKVWQWCYKAL
jgi:hypothetical protein